jgi:hypothetical protein
MQATEKNRPKLFVHNQMIAQGHKDLMDMGVGIDSNGDIFHDTLY